MIVELYTFSTDSFVVAEEWNANFKTLYSFSIQHEEAINMSYNTVAFPDSDLTRVFSVAKTKQNSWSLEDTNQVFVEPEQEYYKTLLSGQDLIINIKKNMNGEARILVKTSEDLSQKFFTINYNGNTIIEHQDNYYNNLVLRAGYYYIMIHESNNVAQVKLIWTGV